MGDRYIFDCPCCADEIYFINASEPAQCPTCRKWWEMRFEIHEIEHGDPNEEN